MDDDRPVIRAAEPEQSLPAAVTPLSAPRSGAGRQEATLRHEFVGMMFAVAIGEVGLQLAPLVKEGSAWPYLPAYSHLLLATLVVAMSWVGWSVSVAPGARQDVNGVFEWPFVVLLLDVVLVIAYFLLVRTVNLESDRAPIAPAVVVTKLVCVIFTLYFVWDVVTKVVMHWRQWDGDWGRDYGLRIIPTFLCLGMSLGIWWASRVGAASAARNVATDVALVCLVLLFRSMKDYVSARWPGPGSLRRPRRGFLILLFLIGVSYDVAAGWYPGLLPVSNHVLDEINAPLPANRSGAQGHPGSGSLYSARNDLAPLFWHEVRPPAVQVGARGFWNARARVDEGENLSRPDSLATDPVPRTQLSVAG